MTIQTMTPSELREAWRAALQSDDYIQGFGSLRTIRLRGPTEYCVLGVLCDVADPDIWKFQNGEFNSRYDRVMAWAGLNHDAQQWYRDRNDKDGLSFHEFAASSLA